MRISQQKVCEICHDEFKPDYRVGDRQRVCRKLSCQQARKRRAQQAWLKKNPGYFKGRYPELREKILDRQKKLKTENATVLSVNLQSSTTIQDELILYKNRALTILNQMLTIQDEITPKFIIVNRQLQQLKTMLYKTNEPIVIDNVNGSYYTRRDCFYPFK